MDESFCGSLPRPKPTVLPCNTHSCPPKWIAEEWGACSRSCGKGIRERRVVCANKMDDIKTRVADGSCQQPKLPTTEHCNVHACPQWKAFGWSGVRERNIQSRILWYLILISLVFQCSVSCGKGIRVRNVECVLGKDGELSAHCDPHTKPVAMQSCSTGIPCNEYDVGGFSQYGNYCYLLLAFHCITTQSEPQSHPALCTNYWAIQLQS